MAVTAPGGGEPVTVRITPKVPIVRLFLLLGYSLDPRRSWRDGEVEVAEHRDLLPALAHAVERQVDRAAETAAGVWETCISEVPC
ncbi:MULTISPECIES: hypothetical protein [unclassified Streptomyces]|uniref:hypothetical protein n=1 Tax=unclassified Streptomyces TaxID=2593676 RepID=UPI0035E1F483